jgi:hypothetical protein
MVALALAAADLGQETLTHQGVARLQILVGYVAYLYIRHEYVVLALVNTRPERED